MDETDRPKSPPPTEPGQSPGYIPRPPTPTELDRISGQQGLVTDEWAPAPPPAGPPPDDT